MKSEADGMKVLYGRLVESRDEYEKAAAAIDGSNLKHMFEEMQQRRDSEVTEMKHYLERSGVDTSDLSKNSKTSHSQGVDLDLKDSDSSAKILDSIIRSEEQLLSSYNTAIKPMTGDSDAFDFVSERHARLETRIEELNEKRNEAA